MPTVEWKKEQDHNRNQDNSGFTNDGLGDHVGRDTLQRGYQYGSLTDGLVAYYPMEESGSEVLHDGALDNLGQINGATWNGSGKVGSDALSFDGIDDGVELPSLLNNWGDDHTIFLWVKTTENGVPFGWRDSVSGSSAFIQYSNGDEIEYVGYDGNNFQTSWVSTTPFDGNWHHVCVTVNSGSITLYFDGGEKATGAWGSPKPDTGVGIGFRGGSGGQDNYQNAVIDHVALYDRALSQQEIQALAGLTSPNGREVGESDVPSQSDNGVARYTFNQADTDGSGDPLDVWGDNDGTDNTSAGYVSGVYGDAKDFDGTDDYVTAPISDSAGGSFTISVWTKADDVAQIDFAKVVRLEDSTNGNVGIIQLDSDETWIFGVGNDGGGITTVDSNIVTDKGSWEHLVITWDESNDQLYGYVNGVTSASASPSITRSAYDGFRMGSQNGSDFFDGAMDDVRVYSDALTPQEVEQLYNKGAYRINRSDVI